MWPRISVTSNQSRLRRVLFARAIPLRTAFWTLSVDVPTTSVTLYVASLTTTSSALGAQPGIGAATPAASDAHRTGIRPPTLEPRACHSTAREYVKRDYGIVCDRCCDHERMEHLVIAEHLGGGVRTFEGVDGGTRRVEHAAEHDQAGGGRAELRDEVGEGHDGYPAERDVHDGADPFRGVDPDHVQRHSEERTAPHHGEYHEPEPPREYQDAERGVRGGDQQEDHRVVEAPHPPTYRNRPRDLMVE